MMPSECRQNAERVHGDALEGVPAPPNLYARRAGTAPNLMRWMGVHGGVPVMVSCAYLRRQAALCLRIAAAVDDQNVVAALMVMADDFSSKADEVDPGLNPKHGDPTKHLDSTRHRDPTNLGPRSLGSSPPAEMRPAAAEVVVRRRSA